MGSSSHHHAHSHSHAHGAHAHGHGHAHGAQAGRRGAFAVSILLNAVFVAVELVAGFAVHSTALIADAGHNLSDVLGLLLAWGATVLATRERSARYTYGLRSATVLAALANGMLLVGACGAIALEAVQRLGSASPVAGTTVSVVAGIGIAVNALSAWLLMAGSGDDINRRGAFLHMAADAAVSLGVVIAGIAVAYTGWYWIDAAVSLVIVVAILWGTWGLLTEALRLSMNAVPAQIDIAAIERYLAGLPGVIRLCDLHVWGLSTTETALTVQLVMPGGCPDDGFLLEIGRVLKARHRVDHATLQVMREAAATPCGLSE